MVIRFNGRVTEGSTTPDVVLMQYTGLKDKSGVEIYEGDILEWVEEPSSWGDQERAVRKQVKYKENAFMTHTEFSVNENYLPILATWGEVIGNIYENSELINSDK